MMEKEHFSFCSFSFDRYQEIQLNFLNFVNEPASFKKTWDLNSASSILFKNCGKKLIGLQSTADLQEAFRS